MPPQMQPPRQPQSHPAAQAQPQPGGQFAQYSPPVVVEKTVIPWYPIRGKGIDIELTDSIIKAIPNEGMASENDPQAKVILALFSEILAMRDQIAQLAQNPGADAELSQRVYNLEATLFEQRNAMQSRARGVQEQIRLLQMQGQNPEQILASLQGQASAAGQMAAQGGPVAAPAHIAIEDQPAAQADMVAQATGQAPPASDGGQEPPDGSQPDS